jgi:2'-5' RNA ligase
MKGGRQPGTRVFVALDPPAEVRAEAEAWARHLARSTQGLRVVPARNSHITLAFLGQRDEYEIDQIVNAIAETEGPVGGLSLGAPVWLPRRRPRSLALDIHDDRGELKALQARLARALGQSLGWKESRPYRAHLTCGRTGRGFDPSGLRLPVSPSIAFGSEAITLYASHLSPEGAEYEAIERFETGAEAQ